MSAHLTLVERRVFKGLVSEAGGVEAAAAILSAAHGAPVDKSTVSRMASGAMTIPIGHLASMEDAAGNYPMTSLLYGRIGGARRGLESLQALSATASIESGEAIAAVIAAFAAMSADPAAMTPERRAAVAKEAVEARDAFGRIVDALQAGAR